MKKLPIFLDTDLLSIFAEIERFELLLELFQGHELFVSSAVHQELSAGLQLGHAFLQDVLKQIGEGKVITTKP
jgi:predicted nucleic acid-binding protein